ncbi:kinase-like protein, partial [Wolfiporia cocos MD-104 SS10]
LTEAEVRGVVKSLVDALIYLRNERICHRDIKASNVLLTEDFRIKLSDFGLATRLPTPESTTQTFCGSPNYIAPEIVARVPYGFSVDVWSLGCLMLTCLSGIPAFEAPSVPDVFKKISRGEYFVPDNISFEAKDLIAGLLQSDPLHRIPLHRMLSHPFFKPSLP